MSGDPNNADPYSAGPGSFEANPQTEAVDDLFTEDTELERSLGLTEACSIVIGRIIGSGIFRTPGVMMIAAAGLATSTEYSLVDIPPGQVSTGLFFLAWFIGGIATMLGALCYAELVAMMPKSGGPYAYLRAAYPEFWTFLRGWAMFFVSETASIVAVGLVFAEYTGFFYGRLTGVPAGESAFDKWTVGGIAFVIIWLLTFANTFGVFLSGIMQNIFSSLKIFALLSIVAFCFAGDGSTSNFTNPLWPDELGWGTMFAVGHAMRYGFFAYSGWEGATYVAEEVKNPRRNLPLSLFVGIGGVMLIYFAVNFAYLYILPAEEVIVAKRQISAVAMENAAGVLGGILIAFFVMLSTFGNVSTQVLVKARTWYAMARDGLFFKPMAKIHPVHRTPNNALYLQGAWATVLLIAATVAGNGYERMIDFFSFTSAVFNVSTFAAVWVLRKKLPDAPRPFRVPLFYVVLPLVLLIQVWFMLVTLITAPVASALGIALTCTGLLYYMRIRKARG
ncbi:MAG: amino acid permease [bacterium]|nr:amino acid permease [bacterium]